MGDSVVEDVLAKVVAENVTETAENLATRIPSTPSGMAVAYGSLVIMAMLPIFVGSIRSVKCHKEAKVCTILVVFFLLKCLNPQLSYHRKLKTKK